MKRQYDEDLFKDSTMTFGEHLEELRTCLWRALLGIMLGFIVGLLVSKQVVQLIKAPMIAALERHMAVVDRQEWEEKQVAAGLPTTDEEYEADTTYHMAQKGYTSQPALVDAEQLLSGLRSFAPGIVPDTPSEAGGVDGTAAHSDEQASDGEAETDEQSDLPDLMPLTVYTPMSDSPQAQLSVFNAQEGFVILIKAALVAGIVLASPWVFWQAWSFVGAGLYPHEKHFVHIFLPFSLGLFLLGAATAYIFVFEPVLDFLFSVSRFLGFRPEIRISEWLSLVLFLPLGFGISFQLPLVMLFLERIGIFDVEAYTKSWRIAVLLIFVIAMFATPADPYSLLFLAGPLCALYGMGILLCRFMPRSEPEEAVA